MSRDYYLHTRGGIFYAELVDKRTGRKMNARSTGVRNRDEALLIVADWLKSGLPDNNKEHRTAESVSDMETLLKTIGKMDLTTADALKIVAVLKSRGLIDTPAVKVGKGAVPFIAFLEKFWDYEKSVYVREKAAHGQRLGRFYCHLTGLQVLRYWKPFFGEEKKLNEVTRADLREFSIWLCEKELVSGTVNKIMAGGTTALTWAYREELLAVNPGAGLAGFKGGSRKPGVLTPAEAVAVFTAIWRDKRTWAANLLAITTGLRAGEIAALRVQDIGEKVVYIRHSWSRLDGLKSPKNGEARQVPLLPEVRAVLLDLIRENPFRRNENSFVFFGNNARRPMDTDGFRMEFQAVCRLLGIDVEGRKIVFHSHRHYYAARMTDRMTAEQVSRITGHKSRAVFDEYAGHITERNLADMGEAGAAVFDNILNAVKSPSMGN